MPAVALRGRSQILLDGVERCRAPGEGLEGRVHKGNTYIGSGYGR